jgi:hypothetical protein
VELSVHCMCVWPYFNVRRSDPLKEILNLPLTHTRPRKVIQAYS